MLMVWAIRRLQRTTMSLACKIIGHKWDGCTCQRCGALRDEEHDWNSCTCRKCGKVRDEEQYHSYWMMRQVSEGPENIRLAGDSCTCSVCHQVRNAHHRYRNGRCEICGATLDADLSAMGPAELAEVAFCARYSTAQRMQALGSLDGATALGYFAQLLERHGAEGIEEPRLSTTRAGVRLPTPFEEVWLSHDEVLDAFAEMLSQEQLASLFGTVFTKERWKSSDASIGLLAHVRGAEEVARIIRDLDMDAFLVGRCLSDHPDRDEVCAELLENEDDCMREGACLALGGHVRDKECNCTRCGKRECHEYVQTSGGGRGSTADVYKCKYCGDTQVYFTDGW